MKVLQIEQPHGFDLQWSYIFLKIFKKAGKGAVFIDKKYHCFYWTNYGTINYQWEYWIPR